MMRLVLLTGQGFEHCYVANRLAAAFPLVRIIVDLGPPRSKLDRIGRLFRKYTTRQLLSRVVEKAISFACRDRSARREAMFRVLGRENSEKHLREDIVTRVHGLNTPAARDLIRGLRPDVLLVYGTGVVSDETLSLASQLALNMHTGISPYYRGAGCAFWPLYNGELEQLGATIHQCVAQIDGGVIYKVGRAGLEKEDDLFCVFARCVKVGAQLYVQTVQELLDGTLQGRPQQLDLGREYRAAMRGWRHELRVRWKIRAGLIRDYVQSGATAQGAGPR